MIPAIDTPDEAELVDKRLHEHARGGDHHRKERKAHEGGQHHSPTAPPFLRRRECRLGHPLLPFVSGFVSSAM
jgi:hypothetical protein